MFLRKDATFIEEGRENAARDVTLKDRRKGVRRDLQPPVRQALRFSQFGRANGPDGRPADPASCVKKLRIMSA